MLSNQDKSLNSEYHNLFLKIHLHSKHLLGLLH